jgi:hypothetical protein
MANLKLAWTQILLLLLIKITIMKTIIKIISKHLNQNIMKKSLLIALFTIVSITAYADVLTVSNSPFGGAQYATLQAAYNAAVDGDTIHLEGTNINYFMNQNWAKRLTVIGIGFNADKQNTGKTYIQRANSSSYVWLTVQASGSEFHGIIFTSLIINYASDVLFANCQIDSGMYLYDSTSGITIRNSVFTGFNQNNIYVQSPSAIIEGVSLSNCVFNGRIYGDNNSNISMNVDHCLFFGTGSFTVTNLRNTTLSNNIFMNSFPPNTNADCNFLNNISRVAGTFPPAGVGNVASGNIAATNPNFVTYTLGAPYSSAHDYNLQAGSAAIAAGSDGTDIGVHGGSSMFFSEEGEVLINPIVREVSILNPTVAPNGTLEVKIIATKPNDN